LKILVVEDSPRMAKLIKKGLGEECYVVDIAEDGINGLFLAESGNYDLVLLDVNLPGMDGFEVIKKLRVKRSDIPVIMVTARDSVEDRIEGLDGGADDYLTKPFAFEELLARIRATMRRPGSRTEALLAYDDLKLDPASGQAHRGETLLSLSAREFSLLRFFLKNSEKILGRAKIYEAVWETGFDGNSNVLDVYIFHLRGKLETQGEALIHSVRGRGYFFGARERL
jgi:two-component system copper resistance phosphate regulon response regulator CusR